jgi:hypothetical protein
MSENAYEVLADGVMLHLTHERDSGVRYARRPRTVDKEYARNTVLSAFSRRNFPGHLRVLTMPGLDWRFERQLLAARESPARRQDGTVRPKRTTIDAIERHPAIWYSALHRMPGAQTSLDVALPCPPFAGQVARTFAISRYYLCSIEAYAEHADWPLGGVWLDFTGPLTVRRLAAIRALWTRTSSTLVVSALRARHSAQVSALLERAGGHGPLLARLLPEATQMSEAHYGNEFSPMTQVVLRR